MSFEVKDVVADNSLKEFGLKLPRVPGIPGLSVTTGPFGFQDARVSLNQSIYNATIRDSYKAENHAAEASTLSVKDAQDVVVYPVGRHFSSLPRRRRGLKRLRLNSPLHGNWTD